MSQTWTVEPITTGACLLRIPFRISDGFHGSVWRLDLLVPQHAQLLAVTHPPNAAIHSPVLLYLGDPQSTPQPRTFLFVDKTMRLENEGFYLRSLTRLAGFAHGAGHLGIGRERFLHMYAADNALKRGEPQSALPAIAHRTTFTDMFGHYRRP